MTEIERQELDRLVHNVNRLRELGQRQSTLIRAQQAEISRLREEARALTDRISFLEGDSHVALVAAALAGNEERRADARAYLADVIREIELCIKQIKAQ